jgi:hypothetical protein
VKDPGLKEYLRNKPQMMGHLCNMPDFYWKSLGGDAVKYGSPAHFIDAEILGLPIKDIPTDYKKIIADYTGKEDKFKNDGSTIKNIPKEFGSAWWRADQFVRRISDMKEAFSAAKPPENAKEEQDDSLPYNKLVFDMAVNMGLMGHFVGDTSQPFHSTADHDGWKAGHGGIHSYYEDAIVAEFDGDLDARVLTEARSLKNPSFLKPKTVVEKMRALGEISQKEVATIFKLDPVIKKSVENTEQHGMKLRTPAERQPAVVGYKRMNKMIVTELARSAVLLASLWDEAYANAGKPKLAAYKSYKYPFTVEFIYPDYFDITPAKAEKTEKSDKADSSGAKTDK